MKKLDIIEVPDKVIDLKHGDKILIYVRNKTVLFSVHYDGDGTSFEINKKEMRRWVNGEQKIKKH